MDIDFARTFLAVIATGNFKGAAEKLHLTQSTVSARIQNLEQELGQRLFDRNRSGTRLTAAGRRFLRHAKAMVRTLEQARQDVGLPSGYSGSLTLSGRIALWQGFLPRWAEAMRERQRDISLRLEIGFEEEIMQGLVAETIDIGVMYTPQTRPGLRIERLFDETLMMVTSAADGSWDSSSYIHIGWGPEFNAQFSDAYPDLPPPTLTANIGWLGLMQIRQQGGSGYFPLRIIRDDIKTGAVTAVKEAPEFTLTAYMVYPQRREDRELNSAVALLRQLAAEEV